jgi:pyruvate dehydrogenase E1 component alpha subunit/2-oxoisovalerate dehydrogenase E1 component
MFFDQMKTANVLSDADYESIEMEVAKEVDESVAFAEAGTWEPVSDLTRFVHSEVKPS